MRKSRSQLVALAAVAVGMLSAGASVASAAPAVFNTTGVSAWNMTGVSVTWGWGAGETVNCPSSTVGFVAANSGSPLQGKLPNSSTQFYDAACTGARVTIATQGPFLAESNGGAFSLRSTTSLNMFIGAVGWTKTAGPLSFTVPWTNPSGPNAAKFTFSQTLVGYITWSGVPVYLTATLTKLGPGALSLS